MDPGRYSAPKSKVADVLSAPANGGARSIWLYVFALVLYGGFLAFMLYVERGEVWRLALMIGLPAGAALSLLAIRPIVLRRDGYVAWWLDALVYPAAAMFPLGAIRENAFMMALGIVVVLILCVACLIAIWLVEARHAVRIYSLIALRSGYRFIDVEDSRL